MKYSVVPASVLHVKPMARRLRAAACITLSSFGFEPRRALHRAYRSSFYSRTALIDGQPVAMWGITGTLMNEAANVWLVISDDISNIPRTIVREARTELAAIMANYTEVATTVLPDDLAAIRFAVFLGFHDREGDERAPSRKGLERQIRENPKYRIPVGDSFVIGLGYHAGAN